MAGEEAVKKSRATVQRFTHPADYPEQGTDDRKRRLAADFTGGAAQEGACCWNGNDNLLFLKRTGSFDLTLTLNNKNPTF